MGGCQNYGTFLGTLNIRCRIIMGIQKGDHNFDNHPYVDNIRGFEILPSIGFRIGGLGGTALTRFCKP